MIVGDERRRPDRVGIAVGVVLDGDDQVFQGVIPRVFAGVGNRCLVLGGVAGGGVGDWDEAGSFCATGSFLSSLRTRDMFFALRSGAFLKPDPSGFAAETGVERGYSSVTNHSKRAT
jgi:hypothetical protein